MVRASMTAMSVYGESARWARGGMRGHSLTMPGGGNDGRHAPSEDGRDNGKIRKNPGDEELARQRQPRQPDAKRHHTADDGR